MLLDLDSMMAPSCQELLEAVATAAIQRLGELQQAVTDGAVGLLRRLWKTWDTSSNVAPLRSHLNRKIMTVMVF